MYVRFDGRSTSNTVGRCCRFRILIDLSQWNDDYSAVFTRWNRRIVGLSTARACIVRCSSMVRRCFRRWIHADAIPVQLPQGVVMERKRSRDMLSRDSVGPPQMRDDV
jgi:hypothetical protein